MKRDMEQTKLPDKPLTEKEPLSTRFDQIREDLTSRIDGWLSMHNHKESLAYLALTANALLFVQLVSSYCTTDPLLRIAYWAGMVGCHLFMREELMRRQRYAILVLAAEGVKARILFEQGTIVESDISAMHSETEKLTRYQRLVMYVLPLGFVNERALGQMRKTKLYADALCEALRTAKTLKPDFIPSIASLIIVALGLCVWLDVLSASPTCPPLFESSIQLPQVRSQEI